MDMCEWTVGISCPLSKHVPVDPLESQLAPVIDDTFAQQGERSHTRQGECAGQRFDIVVEINQHGFIEARLDVAIGMTVKFGAHFLPLHVAQNIFHQDIEHEMRHRPGLGRRAHSRHRR